MVDQIRGLTGHALQDPERGVVEARRLRETHEDRATRARPQRNETDGVLLERVEQLPHLGRRRVVAGGGAESTRDQLLPERDDRALPPGPALSEEELLGEASGDVRRRAAVRDGNEGACSVAVEVGRRPVARHELDGQPTDTVQDAMQVETLYLQQRISHPALPLERGDLLERRLTGEQLGHRYPCPLQADLVAFSTNSLRKRIQGSKSYAVGLPRPEARILARVIESPAGAGCRVRLRHAGRVKLVSWRRRRGVPERTPSSARSSCSGTSPRSSASGSSE